MVFSGPSVVFTVERSAKDWLTEGGGRGCSALVRGGGQPVWRENLGVGHGGGGGGDRLATGLAIAGFL